MLKKILFLSSLFLLVGCDDDSESVAGAEPQVETLSSVDDLPKCGDDNEGALVRVKGEASARICVENKWQFVAEPFKDTVAVANYTVYALGEDIECSTRELSDKSGIKVICNGDSIGVVYNGRDGEDGADGKNGKNGANGKQGGDGKDGSGCSLVEGENGTVTVVCGTDSMVLYKAICGDEPYDPEIQDCKGGVVSSKDAPVLRMCAGVEYDAKTQVCDGGVVWPKCGKAPYNPENQVCENGMVLYTCEDVEYDADKYFCDNRDKKIYRYVTVGEQTWMAENLNYEYQKTVSRSFCYQDRALNCNRYGRLYMWSAAMDSAAVFGSSGAGCGRGVYCNGEGVRGVCPSGWHLPSMAEFEDFFYKVYKDENYENVLTFFDKWTDLDVDGFPVFAAGMEHPGSPFFQDMGKIAYFWTSDTYESDPNKAKAYTFSEGMVEKMEPYFKDLGFSVRCVKDVENE